MSLSRIKKILLKCKNKIREKFSVEEIGIFGSYVRGEQKKKSDLDILVEFKEIPSLFRFLDLEDYLTKILGLKVDLVRKKALKPHIGECILKEVVYI